MRLYAPFAAALAFCAAACSSGTSTSTAGAGTPASAAAFAGNNQASTVGATLITPLTVRITDASGNPVPGMLVTWAVTSGGGTVLPSTSTTDASGKATTSFTLGSAVGNQVVTATTTNPVLIATFTASATANGPVAAITLIASVPTPTGATFDHDTYVRDGLAFASMWNAGMRIYDVGNGMSGGSPARPVLVGSIITSTSGLGNPYVHNAWWFHNPVTGQNKYLFIGQEGPGGVGSSSSGDIHIVDVSNLAVPVEVGFIHVAGAGVHNFWMDEANQVLYAAYYNAGVVKIDVSGSLSGDMSSRITKQVQPGGPNNTYVWGVMLAGGTLYASDMVSGFWALDPVTLAVKGGGNNVPDRLGSDLWVYGSTAYTGTWAGGGSKTNAGNAVKIWSLSTENPPTLVDSLIIPGITTVSDITVSPDGKMLIFTAEGGIGQGLYVYNRNGGGHPTVVGAYMTAQGEHTGEVAVIGGRTYVFCARDPGLQQMDIFDITGLVQ